MTPEEREAVQARADKLLARIQHLETENLRLLEAYEGISQRNRELEQEGREARTQALEVKREAKELRHVAEEQRKYIIGLKEAMRELRDILLLDDTAQTVLNALKHLRKFE